MINERKMQKELSELGELGFIMKYEAAKTEGDVMIVPKARYIEIADMLIKIEQAFKKFEKV